MNDDYRDIDSLPPKVQCMYTFACWRGNFSTKWDIKGHLQLIYINTKTKGQVVIHPETADFFIAHMLMSPSGIDPPDSFCFTADLQSTPTKTYYHCSLHLLPIPDTSNESTAYSNSLTIVVMGLYCQWQLIHYCVRVLCLWKTNEIP